MVLEIPADSASLPYHEPSRVVILTQSSFLILLNVIGWAIDKVLYCGLVAQLFLGIAFGVPGADWLGTEVEKTMVQVGYLGLIMVVYEGGLSTDIPRVIANARLSIIVAIIGISVPIGLSFLLIPIANATPIQCFAAGAALSATSLGTTFSVLSTAGLTDTQLGTVLSSAAMMDDVIGLVMIAIVANLGTGANPGSLVGRPLGASIGLLLVVILGCRFVLRPLGRKGVLYNQIRQERLSWKAWCIGSRMAFVVHTLLLIGFVAIAAWAGTSVLFAAFLCGASITWWDAQVIGTMTNPPELHIGQQPETSPAEKEGSLSNNGSPHHPASSSVQNTTGLIVYEHYYHAVVERILKPLFFASIGFSVPITKMFTRDTIWRGLVYAVLMFFSKVVTGAPIWLSIVIQKSRLGAHSTSATDLHATVESSQSVYPPVIIGLAMVARGEIGFLIAAIAQSNGVFSGSSLGPQGLYIIIVWAILVCTIVGPVGVGGAIRKVKKKGSGNHLGSWGGSETTSE